MPRKIQKRQSTSLRRKQIIDALRKLIIEYGSENVTVRRVWVLLLRTGLGSLENLHPEYNPDEGY
jgi:hypothetical protein